MATSSKDSTLALIIKAVDNATAPIQRVQDKVNALHAPVSTLSSSFANLGNVSGITQLGGAIRTVAGEVLALGKKVYSSVLDMAKGGAEAARVAERAGVKLTFLKEVGYAAQRAGISTEEFAGSLQTLTTGLGKATLGKGKLYSFLTEASPKFRDQIKNAKSTEEAFDLMVAAIVKIPDPMRRAALAQAAFGGSGAKMVSLLKQGPEGIAAMRKQFQLLTGSKGDEAAAQAGAKMSQALVNTVGDAEIAWKAMKGAAFKELIPSFIILANQVKDFFVANRGPIQAWAKDFGKTLPEKVNAFVASVQKIASKASSVVAAVGGMRNIFLALGAGILWPLIASLGGVAIAFGKIALIVGGVLLTALKAVAVAFITNPITIAFAAIGVVVAGAVYLIVKHWTAVKEFLSSTWESIKSTAIAIWTPIGEFLSGLWVIIKELAAAAWGRIADFLSSTWEGIKVAAIAIWTPISDFFAGLWTGIKEIFSAAWEWIKATLGWNPVDSVVGAWDPIKSFFASLWEGVVAIFTAAWERIKAIVDKVVGAARWVKESVSGIVNRVRNIGRSGSSAAADDGGAGSALPRASLDAAGARPITAEDIAKVFRDAKRASLKVSFDNMPKGVKVEKGDDGGEDDIDLDRGFAGASP